MHKTYIARSIGCNRCTPTSRHQLPHVEVALVDDNTGEESIQLLLCTKCFYEWRNENAEAAVEMDNAVRIRTYGITNANTGT